MKKLLIILVFCAFGLNYFNCFSQSSIVFSSNSGGWTLIGNSISTNTNFIGTTSNRSMLFKTNGTQRFKIDSIGIFTMSNRVNQIGLNHSVYFGNAAGKTDNLAGGGNTGIGDSAIALNLTGGFNTAIGANCLRNNLTGSNTGAGAYALYKNTSGGANTAIGNAALFSNTTGALNCAMGFQALVVNLVGINNTAIGTQALRNSLSDYNVSVGWQSLLAQTTGSVNTAIGVQAGAGNVSGHENIFIGQTAGGHPTNLTHRLYINSVGRASIAEDTTKSIIYGYQDQTVANQRLYFNSNTFYTGDMTFAPGFNVSLQGVGSIFCDNYTDRTKSKSLIYRFGGVTNLGPNGGVVCDDPGNLILNIAGMGISVKTGANCKVGTGTLSGGTVVISNSAVTASSLIFLQGIGTTAAGFLSYTSTAGVGFTVTSSNVLDARTFNFWILDTN